MPGAWIGVEVAPAEPGEDGADDVTMLLAANPGEPPAPLAKVASGGELARALLAVRVATAMRDRHAVARTRRRTPPIRGPSPAGPTPGRMLVFDEVDAGIGGEAGAAVGRALAELARDAQVLCVTHLAQVAACARTQVVVRKGDRDGRTVARAEVVGGEQRVTELSTDVGGRRVVGPRAPSRRGAAGAGRCRGRRRMRRHAVRPAHPRVAVEAVARVDKRTKDLTKRMQLGEIAVINHADIDRVAAEGLIAAGVGAVLNAAPSITGRYPNGGPDPARRGGDPARRRPRARRDGDRRGSGRARGARRRGVEPPRGDRARERARRRRRHRGAWRRRGPTSARSSSGSPRTRSSTSAKRRRSRSSRSSCRRWPRSSRAATRWSSCAGTTTRPTSRR